MEAEAVAGGVPPKTGFSQLSFTLNIIDPCNVLTLDPLRVQDMHIVAGSPTITQSVALRAYSTSWDSGTYTKNCGDTDVFFNGDTMTSF